MAPQARLLLFFFFKRGGVRLRPQLTKMRVVLSSRGAPSAPPSLLAPGAVAPVAPP